MSITQTPEQAQEEKGNMTLPETSPPAVESASEVAPALELGLWLRALRSFFQVNNHPFPDSNTANALTRDWSHEARIARQAMLDCSRLALLTLKNESENDSLQEGLEKNSLLNSWPHTDLNAASQTGDSINDLLKLAETLEDAASILGALIKIPVLDFHAWTATGKILTREVTHSATATSLSKAADRDAEIRMSAPLLNLTRERMTTDALGGDLLQIFTMLSSLLERLSTIEAMLKRDQALKQTLPLFTLIYEEARELQHFIEARALYLEGLGGNVFESLDTINYAFAMELRKVFNRELVGLSAMRQASAIYARVEASHGLLRECFQQSTVSLARLFDPMLDGVRLFDAYRTKLKNSLALRDDLRQLLELVRRIEKDSDINLLPELRERLLKFSRGSKFYLMYKDWETCERFTEEIETSRTSNELSYVLQRFVPYLETLYGQVNMRSVLAQPLTSLSA
jgi:hypothetical protein